MRLIIVAGMPGAGKEELLSEGAAQGIPFLRMGDLVREFHSRRPPEDADMSVGRFASAERERLGHDVWARRAMERMRGDVFLVDGCRSMDEVRAYRGLTDDVRIVAIHSSPSTRYARLVRRARDDAPADRAEFEARDRREMGWGLAEVIALSDRLIVNESALEDFHAAAAEVLREVRGRGSR